MIVNNWFVTCNMFRDIAGNNYPIYYFVSFWVIVVLILLNCVLSILIEVYGTAQENVDDSFQKKVLASQLMYMYKGKEEELHSAVQKVSYGKDLELDDKLIEMSKSTEDLAKIINQRNLARST